MVQYLQKLEAWGQLYRLAFFRRETMKKLAIFLILFMIVPVFGAYKLVLTNGAVLELAQKPDLSGKQVTAETVKGKRIIFPARFVDRAATKLVNRKKPEADKQAIPVQKVVPDATENEVQVLIKRPAQSHAPLIITNETLERKAQQADTGETVTPEKPARVEKNEEGVPNITALEEEGEMAPQVDDNGHGEDYWRGKFQENQAAQAGLKKGLKKMQLKLNAMVGRKLQTDDELEKRALTGKIQELQKRIDKAKAELLKLKEEKGKLLEKARTSGALPGWYRDYED